MDGSVTFTNPYRDKLRSIDSRPDTLGVPKGPESEPVAPKEPVPTNQESEALPLEATSDDTQEREEEEEAAIESPKQRRTKIIFLC